MACTSVIYVVVLCCRYMYASCLAMGGEFAAAADSFRHVLDQSSRKFGGRTLPVEQFARRKVSDYELDNEARVRGAGGRMVGIEMIYLWNLASQLSRDATEGFLSILDQASQAPVPDELEADYQAVECLSRGALLRRLGDMDAAETMFKKCLEMSDRILHDTYTVPHAHYELGGDDSFSTLLITA